MSLAFSRSALVRPILDGEVTIEGVDLTSSVINPGDLFWRQLHHEEFDVSELSLAALLIMKGRDSCPWGAIPVFPSRGFFHTNILVRRDAGVVEPADLRGKRVGVLDYQQTAAMWARGVLWHSYGVAPSDIEWHMGRPPERSHAAATGFSPPEGVVVQGIPIDTSLGRMILEGKLDALVGYGHRQGGLGFGQEDDGSVADLAEGFVDAGEPDLRNATEICPLFRRGIEEGRAELARTGILPMNHTVVLRESLAERHPWLPRNLYDAFCRARALAIRRLRIQLEPYAALSAVDLGAIGRVEPTLAYGVRANISTLEAAMQFAFEQGLTKRLVDIGEVFFPSIYEL